jgi:hypothetical protein
MSSHSPIVLPATTDTGRIRLGCVMRLPSPKPTR